LIKTIKFNSSQKSLLYEIIDVHNNDKHTWHYRDN